MHVLRKHDHSDLWPVGPTLQRIYVAQSIDGGNTAVFLAQEEKKWSLDLVNVGGGTRFKESSQVLRCGYSPKPLSTLLSLPQQWRVIGEPEDFEVYFLPTHLGRQS